MISGTCFLLAESSLWSEPKLAVTVAAAAFALLLATIWLLRRRKREGRGAAMICLLLSVLLHGLLLYFVPAFQAMGFGGRSSRAGADGSQSLVTISDFDPDASLENLSSDAVDDGDVPALVAPLPVSLPPSPSETTPSELPADATGAC